MLQARRVVMFTCARRRAEEHAAAVLLANRASLARMIVEAMQMVRANAASIARRLPPHVEKDELADVGFMALVEAAERFDPEHGDGCVTLAQYARHRVRGAMWETVRRRNLRETSHVALPEENADRELPHAAPLSAICDERYDPHTVLEEKQRRQTAVAALECLDDRERRVIQMFYAGRTLAEIAAHLGLCRDRVWKLHRGALDKMRVYLTRRGIRAA